MVKIALIGAGYWGKNWYRTIIEAKKAGYGSAELVAVVDPAGTGNLGAQRLYEMMQYRCIETLPGYYNGKEDAYRMLRFI